MPNIRDYIALRSAPKDIYDYTPMQRKQMEEARQRNVLAEILSNQSTQIANRRNQLANTQTALEMANYGNDKYGEPVQLKDGTYGQPVFNRQGQFLRFEKLPGYTPRSKDKTYGDPILLQDGTYGQPKLNASGQVVGITKIPGYTPMGTTKPDYELATYLSEAEQLEFTNPSTPPARMRQLTTKAQIEKRRAGAQATPETLSFLTEDQRREYAQPTTSTPRRRELETIAAAEKRRIAEANKDDKDPTGEQNKAAGFYDRMESATQIIDRLEAGGYDPSSTSARGLGQVNVTADAQDQMYNQAARNWISANLRKESGAVIGVEEMEQEYVKYFPVLGDTPEVIRQKAEERAVVTRGMKRSAGRALPQNSSTTMGQRPPLESFERGS